MNRRLWNAIIGDRTFVIESADGVIFLDGSPVDCTHSNGIGETAQMRYGSHTTTIYSKRIDESRYEIWIGHHVLHVSLEDSRLQLLKRLSDGVKGTAGPVVITAPMPGLVTKVEVHEGDSVVPGTGLIILEAMKMENEIRSQTRGTVKKISVEERTTVEKGQVIMLIETN